MSWRCARLGFFGRRLVGLMLDSSHHGEAEHDERDETVQVNVRQTVGHRAELHGDVRQDACKMRPS